MGLLPQSGTENEFIKYFFLLEKMFLFLFFFFLLFLIKKSRKDSTRKESKVVSKELQIQNKLNRN